MTDPTIEPAMTIEEIAEVLKKSRRTVYRMLANGSLPCQRGDNGGPIVPRPLFRRYLDGSWSPGRAQTQTAPVSLVQRRSRKAS